jgi:hypothetical protein
VAEGFKLASGGLGGFDHGGLEGVTGHRFGEDHDVEAARVSIQFRGEWPLRMGTPVRIAGFGSMHPVEHRRGVPDRLADDQFRNESRHGITHQRCLGNPGPARLEPDEATGTRRDADRTAAV